MTVKVEAAFVNIYWGLNMFQAIVPADVMISKIDIIPDSLPTIGFLELRNMGCSETINSNRIALSYLL